MTHGTASQNTGTATYIDNMSQIPTPYRTMPPPSTSHSTSLQAGRIASLKKSPAPTQW